MDKRTFVISLGGSLIVPDAIDHGFLKDLKKLVLKQVKRGRRFFIVAGGGNTAREYMNGARKAAKTADKDLDWLGIHSSRLNACLVRTIFGKDAHREVVKDPTAPLSSSKRIIVAGGWKPGWSTDYVSVIIAKRCRIKTVINLSNIKYAYDKDPKRYKGAKRLENVSWSEFRKVVGNSWKPGMNTPFDPKASKKAERSGLRVVIADGKNLKNLSDIIEGRPYEATTIDRPEKGGGEWLPRKRKNTRSVGISG